MYCGKHLYLDLLRFSFLLRHLWSHHHFFVWKVLFLYMDLQRSLLHRRLLVLLYETNLFPKTGRNLEILRILMIFLRSTNYQNIKYQDELRLVFRVNGRSLKTHDLWFASLTLSQLSYSSLNLHLEIKFWETGLFSNVIRFYGHTNTCGVCKQSRGGGFKSHLRSKFSNLDHSFEKPVVVEFPWWGKLLHSKYHFDITFVPTSYIYTMSMRAFFSLYLSMISRCLSKIFSNSCIAILICIVFYHLFHRNSFMAEQLQNARIYMLFFTEFKLSN